MIAYVDCFCGVAGDMLLGALVDAGAPLAKIRRELGKLPLKDYTVRASKVMRGAVRCTNVTVKVARGKHRHHTPSRKILAMIRKSRLPARVKRDASEIFRKLARAEGKIHGIAPDKVAFHEVGAVDSIVDIVGTVVALDLLGVETVACSPLPMSRGEVRTAHGVLPVPAPAAAELLRSFPLVPSDVVGEIVTPTGAAILAALVRSPGEFPPMRLRATGYGAGDYDLPQRPDFLRVLVGAPLPARRGDAVLLLETNLDDIPGEDVGGLFETLFDAGALDVFTTPIQMKKSRPAVILSVLAPPSRSEALERLLLRHTTTFGVRRRLVERTTLDRRTVRVGTPYGAIRVKVGSLDGEVLQVSPEYEDLRRAAKKHGVPLSRVRQSALGATQKRDSLV
ncbi:MAG: nickel pincer cofactor biosynthesis protein LarC [Planctomycetota bacterium]|jgi:uncharacterized protein (TIGR00299 family) protein